MDYLADNVQLVIAIFDLLKYKKINKSVEYNNKDNSTIDV